MICFCNCLLHWTTWSLDLLVEMGSIRLICWGHSNYWVELLIWRGIVCNCGILNCANYCLIYGLIYFLGCLLTSVDWIPPWGSSACLNHCNLVLCWLSLEIWIFFYFWINIWRLGWLSSTTMWLLWHKNLAAFMQHTGFPPKSRLAHYFDLSSGEFCCPLSYFWCLFATLGAMYRLGVGGDQLWF